MDFELTEDQRMLRDTVRRLVDDQIRGEAGVWDREEAFPTTMISQLAELGLLGIAVSEEHDGAGMGPVETILVLEELARGDGGLAYAVAAHAACCAHLSAAASGSQASRWLAPLARGEKLGAWVADGRQPGQVRLRLDGDDWVVDGAAELVPLGSSAETLVIVAPGDSGQGMTAVVADAASTSGLTRTRLRGRLGLRSADCGSVRWNGARLVGESRLGETGGADDVAATVGSLVRLYLAAIAAGVAGAGLEAAAAYALERKQFGRPIGDFQAVQWRLADSATELDAARTLLFEAAVRASAGQPFADAAAKAKLAMGRAATLVTDHAIQIFGGNGYTTEYPVERAYRDAAVCAAEQGNERALQVEIAEHALAEIR